MLRTSLGCEHGEDTGSTSNIEDILALEKVGVVDNGGSVGTRSDRVL